MNIALQHIATGKYLDLGKNPRIRYFWNNPLLQENEFLRGDFSFNFDIPNSPQNQRILGILHKANVKIENNARLPFRFFFRGKYMFDCTLALGKVKLKHNVAYLSVRISRNISRFKAKIQDVKLSEVDTSEEVLSKTTSSQDIWVVEYTGTRQFVEPPIDKVALIIFGIDVTIAGTSYRQSFQFDPPEIETKTSIAEHLSLLVEQANTLFREEVPVNSPVTSKLRTEFFIEGNKIIALSRSVSQTITGMSIFINFESGTSGQIEIYNGNAYSYSYLTIGNTNSNSTRSFALTLANVYEEEAAFGEYSYINFGERNIISYAENFLTNIPFLKLGYIISKIASFTGYSFQGEFMDDTVLQNILVYNTVTLDKVDENLIKNNIFNPSQDKIIYANHYPNLTIDEFLKKLKGFFALSIKVDDANKNVRIDFKKNFRLRETLNLSKRHELIEIDNSREKKTIVIKYKDSNNPNSSKNFDISQYEPAKVGNFENEEVMELSASTLQSNYEANNTETTGIEVKGFEYFSEFNVDKLYSEVTEADKIDELVLFFEKDIGSSLFNPNEIIASVEDNTSTYVLTPQRIVADFWEDYLNFKINAKILTYYVWLETIDLLKFNTDFNIYIKNILNVLEKAETQFENKKKPNPLKLTLYTIE